MKVEISHYVDVVPDEFYNYLAYDFITADSRIRARAYTDTMGSVQILGRLNPDGSLPAQMQPFPPSDPDLAREAIAALDPTRDAEFGEVLEYLRERFVEIQTLSVGGYKVIAKGLTAEERNARMDAIPIKIVDVDLSRGGDSK